MTTAKKSTASSSSNDRAEIRIGVSDSTRELTIESTLSAGEVEALVADALTGKTPLLKLSDEKGKVYLVASANIAFVELGSDQNRRIGFVG